MSLQRYVSRELTHFVGRKFRDETQTVEECEEKQYSLLVEILAKRLLGIDPGISVTIGVWGTATLSSNTMYTPQMVCFCDIPVEDLQIHKSKYSRFGLAFPKPFLVKKGANPVSYISAASSSSIPPDRSFVTKTGRKQATLGEMFDNYHDEYDQSEGALRALAEEHKKGLPPAVYSGIKDLLKLRFEAYFLMFAYLKFFDIGKDDDDVENYYMEREWRVLGNVVFRLDDVCRVILPSEFAKRFRQDLPQYYGQITFAD